MKNNIRNKNPGVFFAQEIEHTRIFSSLKFFILLTLAIIINLCENENGRKLTAVFLISRK